MMLKTHAGSSFGPWPDWASSETAAAIRADILEDIHNAVAAERAFIAAYMCLSGFRRQVFVAILTVGSKF